MLDQRRRRWAGVAQMLYKCFYVPIYRLVALKCHSCNKALITWLSSAGKLLEWGRPSGGRADEVGLQT